MRKQEDRILSKAQFLQWVAQDRVMNGCSAKPSVKERLKCIIAPNYILQFLYQLRKVIGPGAILFGGIKLADGISVGANATVNKSFLEKKVSLQVHQQML